MTVDRTTTLLGTAAEAALAVPGVAALQPRRSPRTAAAVASTGTDATPKGTRESGIRADRSPDGPGWRIEVRCILSFEGRRALEIAQNVHDRVRAAVISRLAALDAVERVTVEVTVTGVVTRYDLT
jgi:hypothetical protein